MDDYQVLGTLYSCTVVCTRKGIMTFADSDVLLKANPLALYYHLLYCGVMVLSVLSLDWWLIGVYKRLAYVFSTNEFLSVHGIAGNCPFETPLCCLNYVSMFSYECVGVPRVSTLHGRRIVSSDYIQSFFRLRRVKKTWTWIFQLRDNLIFLKSNLCYLKWKYFATCWLPSS